MVATMLANIPELFMIHSQENRKKSGTFISLAKKHIIHTNGPKQDIARRLDTFLYD